MLSASHAFLWSLQALSLRLADPFYLSLSFFLPLFLPSLVFSARRAFSLARSLTHSLASSVVRSRRACRVRARSGTARCLPLCCVRGVRNLIACCYAPGTTVGRATRNDVITSLNLNAAQHDFVCFGRPELEHVSCCLTNGPFRDSFSLRWTASRKPIVTLNAS